MKTNSRWVTISDPSIDRIPAIPCCYAVYVDGSLVYVGQTTNLSARLYHHIKVGGYSNNVWTPWGTSASVTVKYKKPSRFGDWAMDELRMIRRLQPIGNVVGREKKREQRG